MIRRIAIVIGFTFAISLLCAALWGWQNALTLSIKLGNSSQSAIWGVRCAAIGLGAAGQVLILTVLGRWVYSRDLLSDVLRLGGVLVFTLSGAIAVALALAGR